MFKQAILLLVFLSFILRVLFIFPGAVSFHYDMSRDAYEAQQIWKEHHLKVLGPPTSTPGLYHGVFYFYLIAPFYALGKGDPKVVALFLSLINSLTIIPIMLLAKDILKNSKWALLAGLLYAISFEATQYGPWLSDPGPAMLTIVLYFYFLRVWQKGQKMGLYLAVFMAGLSAQFEFFFAYLFALIPVFKYIFKIRTNFKDILNSLFIAILVMSSFIIGTIKFKSAGLILGGFSSIFGGSQIDFRPSFSEQLLSYVNSLSGFFVNNFFPINVFIGGLLSVAVLYSIRKEKFILFCLLSNLPIFILGGHTNSYVNAGLVAPAILGLIHLLRQFNRYTCILIISLILFTNLYAIFKYSPQGQILLVIPKDMTLKNELNLIDQTYQLADGKEFSINTLTLPLWINTTWAYLYSWYGQKKYGYVPNFYGHDQVGLLGVRSLQKIDKPQDKAFFIIEPQVGIPPNIYNHEIELENDKTKLVKEFAFGQIKLQLRTPKTYEK